MEKAVSSKKSAPLIFAIGNAPTALVRLHSFLSEGFLPDFIVGVPVGFVNVETAKELFLGTDIPHIISRGRKGGSGVCAAIINAILYDLEKEGSTI